MTTDLETINLLRDSLQRYTADRYDFLQRLPLLEHGPGHSAQAWQDYADMGLFALRLPEDLGGLDADAHALGAVMEIVGSRLLLEPLLASALVGTGLLVRLASAGQLEALLEPLVAGQLKLAFAHEDDPAAPVRLEKGWLSGGKRFVLHGDIADRLLVSARDEGGNLRIGLLDPAAAGVSLTPYRLVDGRGAALVRFDGAAVELLDSPADGRSVEEVVARVLDEANVAQCAEAFGAITRLVAITNDYLKVRKQFGQPLAVNQALQHRMADLYLLQEEARALTRAAEQACALPGAERARLVSGAKAYIDRAARRVANEAIQLHGGVGITEELEVSHYFRRLMVNATLFGSRDEHFQRFVDHALAEVCGGPEHA